MTTFDPDKPIRLTNSLAPVQKVWENDTYIVVLVENQLPCVYYRNGKPETQGLYPLENIPEEPKYVWVNIYNSDWGYGRANWHSTEQHAKDAVARDAIAVAVKVQING